MNIKSNTGSTLEIELGSYLFVSDVGNEKFIEWDSLTSADQIQYGELMDSFEALIDKGLKRLNPLHKH